MKKILFLFILGLFFFSSSRVGAANLSSPSPSPTSIKINSYELFWPIVAGKVEGDSYYFLKLWKEKLRRLLIFSPLKKAEYYLFLSEKRTVEGEKLLIEKKNLDLAKKTLARAQEYRQSSFSYLEEGKDGGARFNDTKNRLKSSLERQRALLIYLNSGLSEEGKSILDENLSRLNEVLAKLQ